MPDQEMTFTVALNDPYDVHVGPGLIHHLAALVRDLHGPCQVRIVSDAHVAPLYAQQVLADLAAENFHPALDIVAAGEESKSIATWQHLMETWAGAHLHRSDLVIALGGGVVGDLTGFAAASYHRGLPFIQVPTTLLAAVDSSVGGKTGLNLSAGKNLVGAFWQPSAVICDTNLLRTLDSNAFADGLAEMVKYAVLADPDLLERLSSAPLTPESADLPQWILRCIAHKSALVISDETDKGARQLLNLGHTVGHAIEALSDYAISHGHAVAIGLAIIARGCSALGHCSGETTTRILAALKNCGLPTACHFSPDALAKAAAADKKADSQGVTLVLPEAIGHCRLHHADVQELLTIIEKGCQTP